MSIDTIVIIGETGVGKSTIANAILGKKAFLPFNGLDAGTLKAEYSYGYLFNDTKNPAVRIIDTQGYNDPKGKDKENSDQMVKLIKKFSEIHLFMLVFNGNNIRWNSATWETLSLFDKMFPGFWNNCIILINFWCENENDKMRRDLIKRDEGSVRDEIFENLRKKFGKNSYSIEYLDAIAYLYPDKHPEKKILYNKISTLQVLWSNMPVYYTDRVKAAQNQKDEFIKNQNQTIKILQGTINCNKKNQNDLKMQNEELKFMLGQKRNNEEKEKNKNKKKYRLVKFFNKKDDIKRDTIKKKKYPKLTELLDNLIKEEVKEISKYLNLPISLTKEKMIENITKIVKTPKKLFSCLPNSFLSEIKHKFNKPSFDIKINSISSDQSSEENISDLEDSDEDDMEDDDEDDTSNKDDTAPPVLTKVSQANIVRNIKILSILTKDELKIICEKLDLPVSYNKDKLTENILGKITILKKILCLLPKDTLKELCLRLGLTECGKKEEMVDKIDLFI